MDKKNNHRPSVAGPREKQPAADPVNYMNHMAETEHTVVSSADIEAINIVTARERMKQYRKRPGSFFMLFLVSLAAAVTIAALLLLIGYILIKGVPNLRPSMFAWEYTTENVSMMPAIINTFTMVGMSLVIAVPLGLFSAIYLVEYAGRGNRLVKIIRLAAETLAGIPSIVYGLFGSLMFGISLHMGYSMLSGALTLAIMVLPTILRTSEEALMSVSDSYREGSFGLGGRPPENGVPHRPSFCSSGHSGRHHPRHRPHLRRDSGPDLHFRNSSGNTGIRIGFGTYPGDSHVCALLRGTVYGRSKRHRGGASRDGNPDQRSVRFHRKEIRK